MTNLLRRFAGSSEGQELPLKPVSSEAFVPSESKINTMLVGAGTIHDDDFEVLERVKDAIDAQRIDLYLQPIVSLPQRKPRYYEAFSRLRDADGRILRPASYIEAAERANRIGLIDNLILTQCIHAIRTYGERAPQLVVFCNISPATLFDSEFFAQFTSFLEENRDLASRLIFELTYPSMFMMHPRVERNIQHIAEIGFSFSVDHLHSLDLDWNMLENRNFRFVKASVQTLMAGSRDDSDATRSERVREFQKRLADSGIDLIAEKLERPSDLPGIISVGLDFGQGHMFGAPRPAEDYLQAINAHSA